MPDPIVLHVYYAANELTASGAHPVMAFQVAAVDEPKLHLWETGVMRITRHPQSFGQALWCLAHTLWIGSTFMVATTGKCLFMAEPHSMSSFQIMCMYAPASDGCLLPFVNRWALPYHGSVTVHSGGLMDRSGMLQEL